MAVLKRLGLGLLKGLLVGAALGAAFQLGLRWSETQGLLGYLLAMGGGATAGIAAGKPPWRTEAWLEVVLRGVFGVGVGALLYWLASDFGAFGLPAPLAGTPRGTSWTAAPLLYLPVIAAIYGALVELDNSDGAGSGKDAVSDVKLGGSK